MRWTTEILMKVSIREIPETGESAEYTLTSGLYIVGVHIPEGVYEAETGDEFDVVSVRNSELNPLSL